MSEPKYKEINTLVEHVQLNKAGWLHEGLKGIIIQIYGERNNPILTIQEIKDVIRSYNDIDFKPNEIENGCSSLISSGTLTKIEKDKYILSEEAFNEFKEESKKFQLIENETIKFFNKLIDTVFADDEVSKIELWNDFIELLIQPLISKMGAKSFEIITGLNKEINYENDTYFFKKYEKYKKEIEQIISIFFSDKNSFVKKFLLNLLKTYYFIEATRLPEKELNKIYELSKVQSNLKIFIDTNFLLSLLDLHDNPSNEAAKSLTNLLTEIKNKIAVKFYVFPITISEFQNLIKKYRDYIKKQPLLLSHARTLIERGEISGISKKYYQKCIETNNIINVDDYFDPYINNLNVILRNNGIELQNQNIEKYLQTNNMSVNDDIIAQVEHRISKYKEKGNIRERIKDEELEQKKEIIERKFKHDCILWHAVNDKRPNYIDSVKDIKNWILTLDFQFLSYDRYKSNTLSNKISLCLHPNDLISLLYFWVPRSDKFEKAVLENFRLPFSFKDFDEKTEQVSMAILSALSYYENSDDIDKDTVAELLTNQALRNKIKPDSSIEENAQLIKEEIFEKYKQKQQELEKEKNENNELKKELKNIKDEITSLKRTIYEFIEKHLDDKRLLAISSNKKERETIEKRLKEKEEELNELKDLKKKFEEEYIYESKSFLNLFVNKSKLRKKILQRYPTLNKIKKVTEETEGLKENLNSLEIELATSVVFFCENNNATYYNNIGLDNVKFIGEKDSAGVFIKVATNPTYFGIRDRDFLTDNEIKRLKEKYPNYRILEYYCFENYLYHPDNIDSLKLESFDKSKYIDEIKKQIQEKRDDIILKLKNARRTYQDLKTKESGINSENNAEKIIIGYLDNPDIEINLKAFSLKDFNKNFINKYNLNISILTNTKWFFDKMKKILE